MYDLMALRRVIRARLPGPCFQRESRFDSALCYEGHWEELMELKQSGKLSDYQERFECISVRSDLSETQKLDCYLGGLKPEIAWDVRLFNPRTVLEATRLARIESGQHHQGKYHEYGVEEGISICA